jgi:hypothetical protein
MRAILYAIILILIGYLIYTSMMTNSFANYIAPYAPKSQKNWYKREGWERFGYPYYSYWESFVNLNDRPANVSNEDDSLLKNKVGNNSPILEYPPESPGPADLYNNNPYHLLGDEMPPPRATESISCVNSRSCYATDFERMISKTGNFRQLTNNYKRGYPDSCSAPYQELVLNFYKTDPMPVPKNNTGGSVSEVGFGLN